MHTSDGISFSLMALSWAKTYTPVLQREFPAPREPPIPIGSADKPDERSAVFLPRRSHHGEDGQAEGKKADSARRAFWR
jgi:hypothetical protein